MPQTCPPGTKRRKAIQKILAFTSALPPAWYAKQSKRLRTGDPPPLKVPLEAQTVLPLSFGEETKYDPYDAYISKGEKGLGIKLKNIDEKAVVRAFAEWRLPPSVGGGGGHSVVEAKIGGSVVRINDVIMAVNNLDARTESFQTVIDKIKEAEERLICIRFARPVVPPHSTILAASAATNATKQSPPPANPPPRSIAI